MRLPWHCYRVLVKGHARRRKDAAAQVDIHEVNSDRPIAHADLTGCGLADVNVLAGEQRRSSAQETESLMDLAGCLKSTSGRKNGESISPAGGIAFLTGGTNCRFSCNRQQA